MKKVGAMMIGVPLCCAVIKKVAVLGEDAKEVPLELLVLKILLVSNQTFCNGTPLQLLLQSFVLAENPSGLWSV